MITRAEYKRLSARSQGFVHYCEADLPGSELRDLENPYVPGTREHKEWEQGQFDAVLVAQDNDE